MGKHAVPACKQRGPYLHAPRHRPVKPAKSIVVNSRTKKFSILVSSRCGNFRRTIVHFSVGRSIIVEDTRGDAECKACYLSLGKSEEENNSILLRSPRTRYEQFTTIPLLLSSPSVFSRPHFAQGNIELIGRPRDQRRLRGISCGTEMTTWLPRHAWDCSARSIVLCKEYATHFVATSQRRLKFVVAPKKTGNSVTFLKRLVKW